jgi:hypothetical protein
VGAALYSGFACLLVINSGYPTGVEGHSRGDESLSPRSFLQERSIAFHGRPAAGATWWPVVARRGAPRTELALRTIAEPAAAGRCHRSHTPRNEARIGRAAATHAAHVFTGMESILEPNP